MTTIKLDRKALAHVIDSDPEFKLELQRNILAEAIRKMVPKDIKALAEILTPEVFADMVHSSNVAAEMQNKLEKALQGRISYTEMFGRNPVLSEKQKVDIHNAVNKITNEAFSKAADQRGKAIAEAIEASEAKIESMIDRKFKSAFDNIFDKAVQEEVNRRIMAAASSNK